MANAPVCNCNALTVPHVHDASGIRAATDMERKIIASSPQSSNAAASRFTPVAKG